MPIVMIGIHERQLVSIVMCEIHVLDLFVTDALLSACLIERMGDQMMFSLKLVRLG